MGLILNIDTATENASICVARDGMAIATMVNREQKDHAGWIQPAIARLMQEAGCMMQQLEAVAVTEGPGSYTGLRVGMATAKGLCYALQIPLITESTLKVIAYATREAIGLSTGEPSLLPTLICPMIDARRMEVFTAVYNIDLEAVIPGGARILDNNSFNKELENNRLIFCGNGSVKWKPLCSKHSNAVFYEGDGYTAAHLGVLSEQRFQQAIWADLAYAEPAYLKEFYSHIKN